MSREGVFPGVRLGFEVICVCIYSNPGCGDVCVSVYSHTNRVQCMCMCMSLSILHVNEAMVRARGKNTLTLLFQYICG
jgi:hypothetical protein